MPTMFDLGTSAGTAAAGNDSRILAAGRVTIFNAGTSYSNNSSQTSVLSGGAITGGWPAGTAAGDTIRLMATGYWLNNSGAGQTWGWAVKFGSTTLATGTSASATANANKHRWVIEITAVYLGISASNSVAVTGYVALSTATTATFDNLQASASSFWSGGTIITSLDTSAGAALDIMTTHSTATATSTSACEALTVTHFPKAT